MPSASHLSYAQRQRNPRRHALGIVGVLGLHALLIWALLSGLARDVVQVTQTTVQALLIDEPAPAFAAPPPPRVKAAPPPPAPTPAPLAPAAVPAPTAVTTPATPAPSVANSPPANAPSAAAPAVRVGASIAPGGSCAKPAYPPASRRLEEEGTVGLRFLIGSDGSVLQSEVVKSSGFARLDEAARQALSKCQFRAGTVDGKPEASWASIQYTWRLE